MEKYFYLEEKELLKGIPCVMAQEDLPIDNYKEKFRDLGLDVWEFKWEEGLLGLDRVYLDYERGVVREATELDKLRMDGKNYFPPEGMFVKNGCLKEKGETPKKFFKPIFDEELECWIESSTLEELKKEKIRILENERENAISEPLEVSGIRYLVNKQGYDDLLGAITLANIVEKKVRENIPDYVYEIEWTDYDDNEVMLKSYDLDNIALQYGMRKDEIFKNHRHKVEKINKIETVEEILNLKLEEL